MNYNAYRLSILVFAPLSFIYFNFATATIALAQDNSIETSIPGSNLKILFTMFGIDNSTGDILGYITANNHTDYRIIKSSDLDHVATGIGQFEVDSNSSIVKVGDQYNACIVLLKSMQRDCIISYKLPSVETEHVGFSVKSVGPF